MSTLKDFYLKGAPAVGEPAVVLVNTTYGNATPTEDAVRHGDYLPTEAGVLRSHTSLYNIYGEHDASPWKDNGFLREWGFGYIWDIQKINDYYLWSGSSGIFTTTDLQTTRAIRTGNVIRNVTSGSFGLFGAGLTTGLKSTDDAMTWDTVDTGAASEILWSAYLNDTYFITGLFGVRSSTDLVTWASRTTGTFWNITYTNGQYLISGQAGTLRNSTNATTWTARTTGASSTLYGVDYTSTLGLWFTYGIGTIRTSTNLSTWDIKNPPTSIVSSTTSIYTHHYDGDKILFSCASGKIFTTTNFVDYVGHAPPGVVFDRNLSGAQPQLYSAKKIDNMYFAAGQSGSLFYSPNYETYNYGYDYDFSTQFKMPDIHAKPYSLETVGVFYSTYGVRSYLREK